MTNYRKIIQKAIDPPLSQISGTDAAFLYAESPNSPMHVGALTIVEGSLSYKDFKDKIASILHELPKFRQRLLSVPFNLGYPYWADDPNFDIDVHLHRIALPKPGDWRTLRDLSSTIFSNPLDHRRPLWSVSFIEGLDAASQVPPGSVAILTKIHHVMIDGVSGMDIMGKLYDKEDKKPNQTNKEKDQPVPFYPSPLPSELSLLTKSYIGFLKNPLKFARATSSLLFKSLNANEAAGLKSKNSTSTVPRTIFNENVSAKRKWASSILSLDRIKVLKNEANVTLNDIILTICSGALRKYLLDKNELPEQPLVANVPISIRSHSNPTEMNNQISNMFIPLATQLDNPLERLDAIHEHTKKGKAKHKALGAKTIAKMADAVPYGLANLAAGIYSRYNLAKLHNPIFNVTITNVPGPQRPLFLNGHKVYTLMAMGPVLDGLGLIIAILSYNGMVTISSTSDESTMPDIEVFSRYIRTSANELEEMILKKSKTSKSE